MVTKEYVLTVAQSKRLIAKGAAKYGAVENAMKRGLVIVCPGTTNTYVLEELTGKPVKPFSFTTGMNLPQGVTPPIASEAERLGYVTLRNGKVAGEIGLEEALKQLGPDDVVIKGANALNYRGTRGKIMGVVTARKTHLVMPVGLEKEVADPIPDIAVTINAVYDKKNALCSMWSVCNAEIITELDAIEILADCAAVQISAGGVLGAEGAVRIAVSGEEENIERLDEIMGKVISEKPFGGRE